MTSQAEVATPSFSSSYFKVYVSVDKKQYSDCGLLGPRYLNAEFPDGAVCAGMLMQQGRTKMKLILENCADHQTEQEFACLDGPAYDGMTVDRVNKVKFIVAEVLDVNHRFVCWVEPVYPKFTIFLVPMSHCHEAIIGEIVQRKHTPLISFRELNPTPPPQADGNNGDNADDDSGMVDDNVTTNSNDKWLDEKGKPHSTTTKTGENISKAHKLHSVNFAFNMFCVIVNILLYF